MKNLCKVLLALIGLFPSITGYAYDIEVDGIYYSYIWDVDSEGELSVEAGENFYTGDVVIPATVSYGGETYTVTKLGPRGFKDGEASHNLTSVKLPATLKAIGASCFSGCLAIDHIELPQSLKCIGSSAFYRTSIDSIYLPANVEFLGTDRYTSGESAYCDFAPIGDFRRIIVDENNPYLVSIDDVVYNKDKTELLQFPTRKGLKTFEVPYGVTHIIQCNVGGGYSYYDGVWRSGNDLQLLILPETAEVCNESYTHIGSCARNLAVRSPQPCSLARPFDRSYNLYVPKGSLEAYRNDVNWSGYATIREFKTDGDAVVNMTWDATLGEVLINDQKATSTSKVTPLSLPAVRRSSVSNLLRGVPRLRFSMAHLTTVRWLRCITVKTLCVKLRYSPIFPPCGRLR